MNNKVYIVYVTIYTEIGGIKNIIEICDNMKKAKETQKNILRGYDALLDTLDYKKCKENTFIAFNTKTQYNEILITSNILEKGII